MSKPEWINSLTSCLARDHEGNVVGVTWFATTLTENVERLPDGLGEAATALLEYGGPDLKS